MSDNKLTKSALTMSMMMDPRSKQEPENLQLSGMAFFFLTYPGKNPFSYLNFLKFNLISYLIKNLTQVSYLKLLIYNKK